ncbi:MAG: hypothetical protein PF484_05435 [Bacteroidales bacterium]|jgi:hypothetical protein|nr:hypothetical protein [Bacteroidales bacterium]
MRTFSAADKLRLSEIHFLVKKMKYSDDNLLDIINYLKESIKIAKKLSTHISKNQCLHNLLQINEKELISMTIKDIDQIERESYFQEVKENFIIDLSMFCIDL